MKRKSKENGALYIYSETVKLDALTIPLSLSLALMIRYGLRIKPKEAVFLCMVALPYDLVIATLGTWRTSDSLSQ